MRHASRLGLDRAGRRPSHGRWLLLLCGVGIGIGMAYRSARLHSRLDPISRTVSVLLSPVEQFGARFAAHSAALREGWFSGPTTRDQLHRAKSDIWTLRLENERLRSRAEKADRLEKMLRFSKAGPGSPVFADVIAWLPSGFFDSITIAAGGNRGLQSNQAVRTAEGLVGKIVDVGPNTARVRLLSDLDSRVSGKVVRDGQIVAQGIVVGEGRRRPPMLRQVKPESPLRAGDVVVTFGDGGVFPPDLPIGIVDAVSVSASRIEKTATLRTFAPEPGDVREVLVVPRIATGTPAPKGDELGR